ncbi:MAG: uracil-DNA glycosylase [Oscillospiraceae bacterium]|jgi:DNA polymerase|nr:uracil-DNA glycosylase [Oscillospiraceae bacterium]
MNKTEWERLRSECMGCHRCSLGDTRKNLVFGDGNPDSEILFIGEGPGEQEDLEGKPFVGRSGKLLDDMLTMIGLDRGRVYIANIVKCRPPNNRDPLNVEQEACIPWLRSQVSCMKPKIIFCLGRIAAQRIIKPDYKITAEHGSWIERNNFHLSASFHPAALLRDPRRKPDAFEDFESLRKKIPEVCGHTELL